MVFYTSTLYNMLQVPLQQKVFISNPVYQFSRWLNGHQLKCT